MAGDWIKFECATLEKAEVLRISRMLDLDKDAVIGKLLRVWIWFDSNSQDGNVDGAVDADVDGVALCERFAEALRSVNWLATKRSKSGTPRGTNDENAAGLTLPNFDRHNGKTAKNRALTNNRQAKWRDHNAPSVTKPSTREEKRREEKSKPNVKSAPAEPFELPAWIPPETWQGFENMRNRIRKPMTERAKRMIVTELEKLKARGFDPKAVLEQSERCDWQDVFPISDKSTRNGTPDYSSLQAQLEAEEKNAKL